MISMLNIASIILVIIIILFSIFVLKSMNKKVKKQIQAEKIKARIYPNKLKKIQKTKDSKVQLHELNKLARSFFKEKLKFKKSLTYLELAKEFKKNKKTENEKFCILISNLIYSGNEIDKKDVNNLIKTFSRIIR